MTNLFVQWTAVAVAVASMMLQLPAVPLPICLSVCPSGLHAVAANYCPTRNMQLLFAGGGGGACKEVHISFSETELTRSSLCNHDFVIIQKMSCLEGNAFIQKVHFCFRLCCAVV